MGAAPLHHGKLRFLRRYVALGLLAFPCFCPARAEARAEERLGYTKTQSYQAALRFLRVDHGYVVVEKDPDSGYLLFEYPLRDAGVTQGSIEVVERADSVALVVQLPKMPSYHERLLIEGLLKKLRDDYGAPPAQKKPTKEQDDPDPAPDEGPPPTQKPGEKKEHASSSPDQNP